MLRRQDVLAFNDLKAVVVVKYDSLGRKTQLRQLETTVSSDVVAGASTSGIVTAFKYRTSTNPEVALVSNPNGAASSSPGWAVS